MPPTSPLFLAYTPEELWLEFYQDYYSKNASLDTTIGDDGLEEDVVFVTEDEGYNKVEQLISDDADEEAILKELATWEQGDTPRDTTLFDQVGDGFDDAPPTG